MYFLSICQAPNSDSGRFVTGHYIVILDTIVMISIIQTILTRIYKENRDIIFRILFPLSIPTYALQQLLRLDKVDILLTVERL